MDNSILFKHYYNRPNPVLGKKINPELFSDNQVTGTDAEGTTEGFAKNIGDETIESSTEQAAVGTKSLKCTVPSQYSGIKVIVPTNLEPLTTYLISWKSWWPTGVRKYSGFGYWNTFLSAYFPNTYTGGTSSWETISFEYTTDETHYNNPLMYVSEWSNSPDPTYFYVDDFSLKKK